MEDVYEVNFEKFLAGNIDGDECEKVFESLRKTGILLIRDPRVAFDLNDNFLDLMEKYFSQPPEELAKDIRKELAYQVGATPENTEIPKCIAAKNCEELNEQLTDENKFHLPKGPDAKWRFFWKLGGYDDDIHYGKLNAPPVIPAAFPGWESTMNSWGYCMLNACETVAEMLAIGAGLERDAFTSKMKNAPHLLAPTGTDLLKYSSDGTIFAGYHYDLNFLTIHGKSRYPGLYAWLHNGTKFAVKVPDGCLLMQAGKQVEYLTGGTIRAGFHEVVSNEGTHNAMEKNKAMGRPLWRVSSTVFSHINSNVQMEPLGKYKTESSQKEYPSISCGKLVENELSMINLFPDDEA